MDIKDILQELNNLPDGYISIKKINGKEYAYLQYSEGGKLRSKYVKSSELEFVKKQLERRKELEKLIESSHSSGKNLKVPSKMAAELTGSLMMGNIVTAKFEKGIATYINEELCPLFIKRTKNIEAFLALRAIDRGRTNSRLLKKALNISTADDATVALYSHGATVTDNYWFKARGSKLKYSDIAFEYDYYHDLSLKGEILVYPKSPKYSPQLTLTGSYEKCWRRIDDKWWLYKNGSENEKFSELFCALLADKLKIPTAKYELDGDFIRTQNFAENVNFEPMISIAGDDDNYENVFSALMSINKKFAKQFLMLAWFDTLTNNVDRHNENCGLLRDNQTGKILSLAPNFDNNLALISRTEVLNQNPKTDGIIKYFEKFLKNNKEAKEMYQSLKLPELNEKKIKKCFDAISIKRDEKTITKYLLKRYEYLKTLQ